MNCQESEKMIYTYLEIDKAKQVEIENHIATCEKCRKIFSEVQTFFQVTAKASKESKSPSHQLLEKVMAQVTEQSTQAVNRPKAIHFYDSAISRWALAAVSCGILILFFIEVLIPDFESGKIKGPITNLQGAIIKSEDFRKALSRPKEKKSLFKECKNILSKQIDANCVREKINKANF